MNNDNRQTIFKHSHTHSSESYDSSYTEEFFWDKEKEQLYVTRTYDDIEKPYETWSSISRMLKVIDMVHDNTNKDEDTILVDITPEEVEKLGLTEPKGIVLYEEIKNLQLHADYDMPKSINKTDDGLEANYIYLNIENVISQFNQARKNRMELSEFSENTLKFIPVDKSVLENENWKLDVLRNSDYQIYYKDIELQDFFKTDPDIPENIRKLIDEQSSLVCSAFIKGAQTKIIQDLTNPDKKEDNEYHNVFNYGRAEYFIRTLKLYDTLIEKGIFEYTDSNSLINAVAALSKEQIDNNYYYVIPDFLWELAVEKGIYLTEDNANPVIESTPCWEKAESCIRKFDDPSIVLVAYEGEGTVTIRFDADNNRFTTELEAKGALLNEIEDIMKETDNFLEISEAEDSIKTLIYSLSAPEAFGSETIRAEFSEELIKCLKKGPLENFKKDFARLDKDIVEKE